MLRQSISATSRALRSTARLGTQRQIARPQYFQTPLVAAARAIAPRTRWYSSETEAANAKDAESKESGEGAAKAEAVAEAESPEAALRKQLEAKDAEIRDLKVCIPFPSPCSFKHPTRLTHHIRTGTSAPWPTSATCKTGHSAT